MIIASPAARERSRYVVPRVRGVTHGTRLVRYAPLTSFIVMTGPDFIPKLTADAVQMKVIDRVIAVPGAEALRCAGELATKEGIFVGITAGATFAGALRVCAQAPRGANVLCMLPDTGERYLSTPLFADVPADMTEEELAISRSVGEAATAKA